MEEEIGKKEYRHAGEKKKKSFSRKKLTRTIFFIVVVIFFAIVSHKVTRYFMIKHYENLYRDMIAKVEEDSQISNYYEKKIWDGDITRETWRMNDNYLIVDVTTDEGTTREYYYEGKYYILNETVDELSNQSSKNATLVTNIKNTAPSLGMKIGDDLTDEKIHELAKMSSIKSVKMEGIPCYCIYIKGNNEFLYMRKSDNRVIRQVRYEKDGETDEIVKYDSGVIEIKENVVTDADVAIPDLSGYNIQELDANQLVKETLENSNSYAEENQEEDQTVSENN